jgi:sugar-specific transcriptional regulator TrmB
MLQSDVLRKLGLNKAAVKCYVKLLKDGPSTTDQLAKRLSVKQTNLYGTLKDLTSQGFIVKHKLTSLPATFSARPLHKVLPARYMHQRSLLLPLCRELGVLPPPALPPLKYK